MVSYILRSIIGCITCVESLVTIQARRQDSVTGGGGGGGRNKFWEAREVYFVSIREGHRGTWNLFQSGSNKQGEEQKVKGIFRLKSEFQAVFPAENRWSPKQKKRFSLKLHGVFRPKSEFQALFPAENRWSPKKKKGKRHKIWCQSTKNTNLDLDSRSRSPSLLISSGHSPRLGGTSFVWGGTSSQLGGHGSGMPPRGVGSVMIWSIYSYER